MQSAKQSHRVLQRLLSGMAVLLLGGGCATLPPLPAPQEQPPLVGLLEAKQQIGPAKQTLGVGDTLRIAVYDNPDLSQEVTIGAEGAFQYPLIGRVQAAGLSAPQVEALLTQRLADGYLLAPQVGVTVTQHKSQQVYVIGAVKTPGVYPLQRPTALLEVLSAAGGPSAEAGFEVVLVRATEAQAAGLVQPVKSVTTSPGQAFLRVQLESLLSGAVSQRIDLQDGDVVYVPAAAFFFVAGEVQRPGRYRLERDMTIFKAVTLAGGFTKFAATKTMLVRRKVGSQLQDFQAEVNDLLQADDTVVIQASLF